MSLFKLKGVLKKIVTIVSQMYCVKVRVELKETYYVKIDQKLHANYFTITFYKTVE